jgi:hypothetical protein
MYSGKKEKYDDNGDGTYHAGWIVGPDPEQDSGFFIHRLNHTQKLEDLEYDWTEEEIRDRMGFSREWQGGDIQEGEFYRVQGDIRMKKVQFETVPDVVEDVAESAANDEIQEQQEAAAEEHEEEILGETSDHLRIEKLGYRNGGCRIKARSDSPLNPRKDLSTAELKELQDEIEVSEEQVRAFQDDRDDWQQLTADRRQTAIRNIYADEPAARLNDILAEAVDEESIWSEAQERSEERIGEEAGQRNMQIGNHVLMFSAAVEHPKTMRGDEYVVVPDESKLFVIHDEHRNEEIKLDQGVYLVDQLDRHDRR